jgi:hypothetical protein
LPLRDHGSRREETRIQRDEIRIQKRIKEKPFEKKLTQHIKYFQRLLATEEFSMLFSSGSFHQISDEAITYISVDTGDIFCADQIKLPLTTKRPTRLRI